MKLSLHISQAMLDKLAESRGDRKFELRVGNGFAIPASDSEFDLTFSRMFIQHFADWPGILSEKARVTRQGGIVLFDFGNQEHLDSASPAYSGGTGFPYDNNPMEPAAYYAVATTEAMTRQANALGLDVVEISPTGLMLANGFQWNAIKAQGIESQDSKLDGLLRSREARELLELIELSLLPLLPKKCGLRKHHRTPSPMSSFGSL
jgi:hypothetical protein